MLQVAPCQTMEATDVSRTTSRKHARQLLLVVALLMASRGTARAQTMQVWPEVSTFVKMTDSTRLYLLATTVREDSEATSGEFGPNLDIYFRPIGTRKHWAERLGSTSPRIESCL